MTALVEASEERQGKLSCTPLMLGIGGHRGDDDEFVLRRGQSAAYLQSHVDRELLWQFEDQKERRSRSGYGTLTQYTGIAFREYIIS